MGDDNENEDDKNIDPTALLEMNEKIDKIITDSLKALEPHCNKESGFYETMVALSAIASVMTTLEMKLDKMGIDWDTISRIRRTGEDRAFMYFMQSEGKMVVKGEDEV